MMGGARKVVEGKKLPTKSFTNGSIALNLTIPNLTDPVCVGLGSQNFKVNAGLWQNLPKGRKVCYCLNDAMVL